MPTIAENYAPEAAAWLKARCAPPRIVRRGDRVTTRVSTNPAMNCNGGDYDHWYRPVVYSVPQGMEVPYLLEYVGRMNGRDFYRLDLAGTSSEFDMCPACGSFQRTGGDWGFCDGCDPSWRW